MNKGCLAGLKQVNTKTNKKSNIARSCIPKNVYVLHIRFRSAPVSEFKNLKPMSDP